MNIQTSPIDAWLEHTAHVEAWFNSLIENDPTAYEKSICTHYLSDHNKDAINEQTILLAKLQESIYKCHSKILQLSGVGYELSQMENVKKLILTTVSWIEEIFCYSIVDWAEMQHLYHEQISYIRLRIIGINYCLSFSREVLNIYLLLNIQITIYF